MFGNSTALVGSSKVLLLGWHIREKTHQGIRLINFTANLNHLIIYSEALSIPPVL